ncbi:MAG TPA: methyltransferase domain-containing protein [Terriglobales bacterium]|nr:methyltransferase domain-containing protein [Terriglobales bacterium]
MMHFTSTQRLVDAHFSVLASYWNDVYEGDSVQSIIYRERRDLVLRLVDELSPTIGSEILDIGCGAGLFSVALAKRGFRVRAIDPVEAMRIQTSVVAASQGLQDLVRVEEGNAHQLRYKDATFDVALAVGVIPWLHSPNAALKEISRVLRPGGHLIVTADNRNRLSNWLDPRFCPLHAPLRSGIGRLLRTVGIWREPHACTFSLRSFDRALAAAGLTKIKGFTLGYGPFTLFEHHLVADRIGILLHHKLNKLGARISLLRRGGSQYVVLARKS